MNRNILWHLSGVVSGILAALLAIPLLINNIGEEGFSVVAIALVIVGYLGVLDLGIARAMTYFVAQDVDSQEAGETFSSAGRNMILSGVVLGSLISVVLAGGLWAGGGWIAETVSQKSDLSHLVILRSLNIVALAIPFVILANVMRGVLEGVRDFKAVNTVIIPGSALLYLTPAVVSHFLPHVEIVMLSILVVRVFMFGAMCGWVYRKGFGFSGCRLEKQSVYRILGYGRWITISGAVSPIMQNLDRVFVAVKLGLASVAVYVPAYEVAYRALIIPAAISNVFFPEFAKRNLDDREDRRIIIGIIAKYSAAVFVMMLAAALVMNFAGELILTLWLGDAASSDMAKLFGLYGICMLIIGMAYIPFAFVQGSGHASFIAKLHIVEALVYVPVLLYMIDTYGLMGVAYSWMMRAVVDMAALTFFSYLLLRK